MGKLVQSTIEAKYDGVKRYKGEIFELRGSRNDETSIRVGNLKVFEGDPDTDVVHDDSGRMFVDENARRLYRIRNPDEAKIDLDSDASPKRGPGRPKGRKDSAPRRRTIDRAVNTKTAGDE